MRSKLGTPSSRGPATMLVMEPMPLTNAEKQQRWRERNQIVLTGEIDDIAATLIAGLERVALRKLVTRINKHLNAARGMSKADAKNRATGRRSTDFVANSG